MSYKLLKHTTDHIIKEINAFYDYNNLLCHELKNQGTFENGKYLELYAISKEWLNIWINHTKYNEIEDFLKKNNKKNISQEEFFNFYPDKQSLYLNDIYNDSQNILIYDNNKYKDIKIDFTYNLNNIAFVDKNCLDLFSLAESNYNYNYDNNKIKEIKAHGLYKKNKLIVSIEKNCYNIVDYSDSKQKKECNIFFDNNNKRISVIIQEIINSDNLLNFFKSSKINIKNEDMQKITYHEQTFLFEDISFHKKNIIINHNNNIIKKNSNSNNNGIEFTKDNINNNKNKNNKNNTELQLHEKTKKKKSQHINNDNNNPCLVGLTNIGSTCYMNAVLQCFSNIKLLTNYLLKEDVTNKIEKNKNSKIFSFEYLQLLKHLWLLDKNDIEYYQNHKSFSPYNFKNVLGNMNNLFINNEANDSKDLILFMQEQLHKELNFLDENKIIQNNNKNHPTINQFNENEVINSFFNYFKQNYKSCISDVFYGTQKTKTDCLRCGASTYNYQIFSNLFFPLEEVRKFKSIPNYNGNTAYVTLYDCLDYFQQTSRLSGQNDIYCNNCMQTSNANYTNNICIMPNVIIIILNRGKGLQFNVNINISEVVDLANYVQFSKDNARYQLIGTIIHFGDSNQNGHFIAICKNKNDGQWYRYNDSIINRTNFDEIKKTGIPYVLFYQISN